MFKSVQPRPWREVGILNRIFRTILYCGIASFAVFWVISIWLQTVAFQQPNFPTGIFQYPYAYKGRIGYLTHGQAVLARAGNIAAFGFAAAFVAIVWLIADERRAETGATIFSRSPGSRSESTIRSFVKAASSLRPVTIELTSPFSAPDCLYKLQLAPDVQYGTIIGKVKRRRFIARQKISYRNSFQTHLSVSFYTQQTQTLIRCRFSMALYAFIFIIFWFGAVCSVGLISLAVLTGSIEVHRASERGPFEGIITCLIMLAFGIALLLLCRNLAENEQDVLLNFVRKSTGAQEANV